ncbi:MAG: glycine-rich protein, partial [Oscillospiraceae bacterium]|nr:glycine-rich protein [Oscillospiraceae bacterium]
MILSKLVNKNTKLISYLCMLICLLVSFIIPSKTVYAVDYTSVESPSLINWGLDAGKLQEGYYKVTVEDVTYPIHLYVFEGDQTWTSNMTFGDAGDAGTSTTNAANSVFVVVKGNLTINSGVTVTTYRSSYGGPKGLFLFVSGTLVNNGTITMTARGAKAVGENVYLWRNVDGSYEYVPATGGAGGAGRYYSGGYNGGYVGLPGTNGTARSTGGGGAGGAINRATSGSGATGTSYSGGAGGGGAWYNRTAGSGVANGGAGGAGNCGNLYTTGCGGGAGNPGGAGSGNHYVKGADGTGGLLTIYSGIFENNGTISSNGSKGGNGYRAGGGGSGGGSINIFYTMLSSKGTITATAGDRGYGTRANSERINGGIGGAGSITTTELVLEEEFLHPTLSSLEVEGQTIYPSFNSNVFNYGVTLDSETSTVNIKANVTHDENTITSGIGEVDVPIGSSTHNILVTSKIGIVQIYSINFYRPPSSYKYLKDITINGNSIENFNPQTLTYNITLPYSYDIIDLDVVRGRTSQEVYGIGELNLNSGSNKIILTVISEDGNYTTNYTLNIFRNHSSKLKSITIDDYELDPVFDPETNTYTITIMSTQLALNVTATPYDEEAQVKLSGFGYIKSSQKGTITVTEPNSVNTTYTVNIIKEGIPLIDEYTYSYTGQYQTFVAPATGFYKIELWGAQGGNSVGNNSRACSYGRGNAYGGGCGGFGAYTSGVIKLNKGETLYVYVGQRGLNGWASHNRPGGWNGGGSSTYDHSDNEASGSGG